MSLQYKIELALIPLYLALIGYFVHLWGEVIFYGFSHAFYYLYSIKLLVLATPILLWKVWTSPLAPALKVSRSILIILGFMVLHMAGSVLESGLRFPSGKPPCKDIPLHCFEIADPEY